MHGRCPNCLGQISTSGRCWTHGCVNYALAPQVITIPAITFTPIPFQYIGPPPEPTEEEKLRERVDQLERRVRRLERGRSGGSTSMCVTQTASTPF